MKEYQDSIEIDLEEKNLNQENEVEVKIPLLHKIEKKENTDSKTSAKYVYRDENGKEVFTIHKRTGRGQPYLVSHTSEDGDTIFKLPKEADLPIYNLPKVKEAISKGDIIWITEGESKVDMLTKLGVTATTVAFKETNKWHDYYNTYLIGARSVIMLVDNDEKSEEFSILTEETLLKNLEDLEIKRLYIRDICSSLKEGADIEDLVEKVGFKTTKDTLEAIEASFFED